MMSSPRPFPLPDSLLSGQNALREETSSAGDGRSFTRRQHNTLLVFVRQNKLAVALILVVCTMASKRRQGDSDKTEKKKQKSCEEKADLCPLVEDEQLKRAVREAWSQKSHYSQGRLTEHNSFTKPDLFIWQTWLKR